MNHDQGLGRRRKNASENAAISIRLNRSMLSSLKQIAKLRGLPGYQTLIKTYVATGLSYDAHLIKESPDLDFMAAELAALGVPPLLISLAREKAVAAARAAASKSERDENDPE